MSRRTVPEELSDETSILLDSTSCLILVLATDLELFELLGHVGSHDELCHVHDVGKVVALLAEYAGWFEFLGSSLGGDLLGHQNEI